MTPSKKFTAFTIAFLIAVSFAANTRAGWPARVFAPYMYIGEGDHFKLTDCADACGLKYYTLAFIIARQEGEDKNITYHPEPAWDGRFPVDQDVYKDQIDAIRKRGGDVIMSFGGEAGKELANIISDPARLEAAYQQVIDRYQFTWLDFDVEGSNLDQGRQASEHRNTVLARLQAKNPGLLISFTLPVDPNGLSGESQALLADAKARGVKVHSVNLMVMYFGRGFINRGKSEGQLGVDSATATYAQLQKIDPAIRVGLCPCLGRNGSRDEIFTLADARTLKAFADKTPWVCSLHYWSINADDARPRKKKAAANSSGTNNPAAIAPGAPRPWDFANLFKTFTAP